MNYKRMEDKVLREKRTYTIAERKAQNELHAYLTWDMMQAIDGTTRIMPEYLNP